MKTAQASKKTPLRRSYRPRIDEMCRQCLYDPHQEGTWRKQVENCTATRCPLFDVRPVPTSCISGVVT